MARSLRIEYSNAWYHVTSRGNEGVVIFRDDNDRKHFLQVLTESLKLFKVQLHCYVLMTNHFHFLLKTLEANLSRFMQRFSTAYTTYFNLRHQRHGHLYQGRFKAILVDADEYLLQLSRYIHLNPVRLAKYKYFPPEEKAKVLKNYQWSSLCGYIRLKYRDDFMQYGEVLGYMGGDDKKGRERYWQFVWEGLEKELLSPLKETKANAILGSDNFISWANENFVAHRAPNPRDYTHLKSINRAVPIEEIAAEVAKEYGVRADDIIKSRSKSREARQVLLEISHRLNLRKKNLREMGIELGGISGEAITKIHNRIKNRIKIDEVLSNRITRIIWSLQKYQS
ncbi:MAG: transposase [Candidatus Aureabacteria bacterium]|nr:transposase [Candidatus Auribacterota bacterium]